MHPYTKGLLDSVPSQNTRGQPLAQIPGMTPSLLEIAGWLRVQGALPDRHRPVQRDAGAGSPSPGTVRALLAGGRIGPAGGQAIRVAALDKRLKFSGIW